MEAAAAGLTIDRLAVYEVPYCSAGDMPKRWREYDQELGTALAENRPGDAVALFVGLGGTPAPRIAEMRFFDQPADLIGASIPGAERQTLPGQMHLVDPPVMAVALERFFL